MDPGLGIVRAYLMISVRLSVVSTWWFSLRPRSPDPTVIILLKYIGIVKIGSEISYDSFVFSCDAEAISRREDSNVRSNL